MNHPILWTAPAPLWGRFGDADGSGDILARFSAPDQARPAILRFDSDDFMERLLGLLERSPQRLGELVARPETWRTPLADTQALVQTQVLPRPVRALQRLRLGRTAPPAVATVQAQVQAQVNAVPRTLPLKLFHPASQRHYLVAANLVCARAGFPDRALATGAREQVGLVVRRLLRPGKDAPAATPRVEYAFVKDAQGARWQRVVPEGATGSEADLVAGEELLPLFPLNFEAGNGQPRRLHAGIVPVGRRDEYMTTRKQDTVPAPGTNAGVAATPSPIAERKEQFRRDVSEPWKNVVRSAVQAAARASEVVDADDDRDPIGDARKANQNAQVQSWLVLLDFADFLAHHLDPVWRKVKGESVTLVNGPLALYDWLASTGTRASGPWEGLPGSTTPTLAEALKAIVDARQSLEQATGTYPAPPGTGLAWPAFSFLLAGVRGSGRTWTAAGLHQHPGLAGVTPLADRDVTMDADPQGGPASGVLADAEAAAAKVDKVVQLVVNALDATQSAATPPLPFAAKLRDALATTEDDEGWFVLRCVYQRCDCGPLKPEVVSPPSARFQLASFFDPDAPARPIRIALPLDTTPAGLRKFDKNAALMLSDVLCGQVQRAKGLGLIDLIRHILPWPLHKDLELGDMGPCKSGGNSIGMICSLSIPIVTICALILMMIIVSLLDFIFRWLPFLVVCLPIPKGLKAKLPTGGSP